MDAYIDDEVYFYLSTYFVSSIKFYTARKEKNIWGNYISSKNQFKKLDMVEGNPLNSNV